MWHRHSADFWLVGVPSLQSCPSGRLLGPEDWSRNGWWVMAHSRGPAPLAAYLGLRIGLHDDWCVGVPYPSGRVFGSEK
jgi:hypothetical protein